MTFSGFATNEPPSDLLFFVSNGLFIEMRPMSTPRFIPFGSHRENPQISLQRGEDEFKIVRDER
jgi:hypothetical protein